MGNLAYKWREGLLTYLTYSEGYKSGGFTQRIFPPEPSLPSFDPEFVTSYEIGVKLEALDNRLRLNLAGFFADYKDLQLLVADPSRVGPFVTNAGDAEIKGLELELTLAPAEGWLISGSAGLTDPKRTRLGGPTQVVQGLTIDSRFEHISKWMANLQIEKRFPLGMGYITPRAEWSYRSGFGTNSNNVPREGPDTPTTGPFAGVSLAFGVPNPRLFQPAFSLYNASLRWEAGESGFWFTGGVDNISDKEYRVFGNYQDAFGMTTEAFDRGRQWYVALGYKF
jgi:iron complex outermembrane recepter protein